MTTRELSALGALRFNYTHVPDDVWRPSPFHVESLHRHTTRILLTGVAEAKDSRDSNPIGVVVQGQRGTGKTHLLGWLREQVQHDGGYFFLVGLLDAKGFWESTVVSMFDSLSRSGTSGESQLTTFLERLSALVDVPRMVRRAVSGKTTLSKEALDTFIEGLRRFDRQIGRDSQDTARALALLASHDLNAQDIADSFLSSAPEEEPGERAQWGIRQVQKSPQEIVRDLSRLLSLTGPSVIAIDQIDALLAQSWVTTDGNATPDGRELVKVEQVAHGLMALREVTRRTLTVVSCIPATWVLIEEYATDTVRDRFRQALQLMTIPDAETGRLLVAKRFEAQFGAVGFEPPYPTWPVRAEAFEDAPDYTARQLLIKIDNHIQSCLLDEEIRELEHFGGSAVVIPRPGPTPPPEDLAVLDTRFAELRKAADIRTALSPATEDVAMPALLSAGLAAWVAGLGDAGREFTQDPPPSSKPPLHARLRRILDEHTEDEAHWAFRAIASENAVAALNRLRNASVATGLDADVPKRRLFVLRNAKWANGPRTREALAAFERAGGRILGLDTEDLTMMAALRTLIDEDPPGLRTWLASRRPAADIKLFNEALEDAWTVPDGPPALPTLSEPAVPTAPTVPVVPPVPAPQTVAADPVAPAIQNAPGASTTPPHTEPVPSTAPYVTIGRAMSDGAPMRVDLETLRKHTAIFAGSGSGKTVLIRRLVEECALQGVSAIVLDPNNDLSRLGDPWPEAPPYWGEGDATRAEDYLANTDVVIWTPRWQRGRPLSFQPLPDFASVTDDPDEFDAALDVAVASIVPRARLGANTHKAQRGQAVLRETVRYYGRQRGRTTLKGLIELLSDLPDGVSDLDGGAKIAADLAQTLTAAMVNDPMFGGQGTPVDPGLLLTPPDGKRARISVISFIGLQGDEQRQSFVNQLQMALFAWIKRNPAGDRPLGGLFVMDEAQTFAPSTTLTPCTRSTLALASQARKYGLGLVFATQAPKGLHNQIPGNAATQFFGLLNSPVQIASAKEIAQAKGSGVDEISRLGSGQFYVASEGTPFVKVRVPMCLSHHPKAALTTDEVIERANSSISRTSEQ
ncbi:ATP-binding protein [Microtetraspora sp. NBRC 16547]|uniref:ATP-binding protein n=1 Tax=Microtetraspora sp. NBRC 16547 TaxID=3030993 RepID=UPI0024A3BA02|nr:ATP-binding protein [Microtetraspora sp. NBRC 16547]GLX00618.1 ATPase [Microtetraspora sp. NBRC 16547]